MSEDTLNLLETFLAFPFLSFVAGIFFWIFLARQVPGRASKTHWRWLVDIGNHDFGVWMTSSIFTCACVWLQGHTQIKEIRIKLQPMISFITFTAVHYILDRLFYEMQNNCPIQYIFNLQSEITTTKTENCHIWETGSKVFFMLLPTETIYQ